MCRRGGCAVQDEPGSRRSYCHAKATIKHKQRKPALTRRLEGSEGERARLKGSTAASSWAH